MKRFFWGIIFGLLLSIEILSFPINNNVNASHDTDQNGIKDFYTIYFDNGLINIFDSDKYIFELLGLPLKQEVEVLGYSSLIYSIKSIKYQGIDMYFENLEKDGPYFLAGVTLLDSKYRTSNGIRVGDSLENLIKLYPKLSVVSDCKVEEGKFNILAATDGRENVPDHESKTIEFELINEKITAIRVYADFP